MSAFIVGKVHIDALVTAGLRRGRVAGSPLRWYWPEVGPEDPGAFAEGEPWGPGAVELARAREHELTAETAGRVGAMLWAENVRSVNHRYAEDELEDVYEYERWPRHADIGRLEPVAVLKALDCYEYQSCEHPGWRTSEARTFCEALRSRVIGTLPGYADAAWEIAEAVRS